MPSAKIFIQPITLSAADESVIKTAPFQRRGRAFAVAIRYAADIFRRPLAARFGRPLQRGWDGNRTALPIRKNDGSLDAKQVEISREDSSFGFVDYTWTRLYKQIYRINDTKTALSTEDMIRSIYRTFGIDLPSDPAASFEDLGTMTELASLSGDERENTMNTIPMPALIEDANGIALMLGRKDGLWQCLRVVEGKAMIVEIEEPQRMVIIK